MATKRSQRIGIWIIAIVLVVSTIAMFVALMLAPGNEAADQRRAEELQAQYMAEMEEHEERVQAQAAELSEQYYDDFIQYRDRVGEFDADVDELTHEDLVTGDGEALTSESTFTAYYIGWTPDGEIFDSSINDEDEALNAPITAGPGMVIEGWIEGVDGMNIGGVREITIPAEQAYGEQGSGEAIAPNTPLRFVMMVIPEPETIEQPEPPQALMNYYQTGRF